MNLYRFRDYLVAAEDSEGALRVLARELCDLRSTKDGCYTLAQWLEENVQSTSVNPLDYLHVLADDDDVEVHWTQWPMGVFRNADNLDWLLPAWAMRNSTYCLMSMRACDWVLAMEQCGIDHFSVEPGT